jgi:phosphoribosylformylglycinamidine synthase subunit PurS
MAAARYAVARRHGGGVMKPGARPRRMKVRVQVMLKPGVLDPQGKAIGNALAALGFGGIGEVRQGKVIEIELSETDPARIRQQTEAMCKQLLANPVTEIYAIEIIAAG